MKHSGKIVLLFSFCCLALIFMSGDAYAADVLQTVRDKAASFIKSLRPLIFILAGFGLIGFAFGAIFGKISWKWFANIAIGLFLVANVGLFIDYFATRSGAAGQYAQDLGYGKYLDESGGYTPTEGSPDDPKPQTPPNGENDGDAENGDSEGLGEDCIPGTGTGCETGSGKKSDSEEIANTKEACSAAGGVWLGSECEIPEEETPDEDPLPGTGFEQEEAACKAKGGYWIDFTCKEVPEEETPDEAPPPGTGFENEYDIDGGELDELVVTGEDKSDEKQRCILIGGQWNSATQECEDYIPNKI